MSAGRGLGGWFANYNEGRPHQALGNATPEQWYRLADSYGGQPAKWEAMQVRPAGQDAKKLPNSSRAASSQHDEF